MTTSSANDAGSIWVHDPFSMPFCNDGGPMLVLPSDLLSNWCASDWPDDGRPMSTPWRAYVAGASCTDHDRAGALRQ